MQMPFDHEALKAAAVVAEAAYSAALHALSSTIFDSGDLNDDELRGIVLTFVTAKVFGNVAGKYGKPGVEEDLFDRMVKEARKHFDIEVSRRALSKAITEAA